MEGEFKRIYDCMRASETIVDGEYFVIHADHLHDFEMAIGHYFDENKLIEKVNTWVLCDSDFTSRGKYSLKATEIIDSAFEEYSHKINEIIDKLNRTER